MSEPVRGVIVAHADLAAALVHAVESISGVSDALIPLTNRGVPPEELRDRVESAVGKGPAIIFCDLGSGSCAFTSRLVARRRPGIAVLSGTNLPMLLDFVFHREMEVPALVDRLVRKARAELAVQADSTDLPSGADQPV